MEEKKIVSLDAFRRKKAEESPLEEPSVNPDRGRASVVIRDDKGKARAEMPKPEFEEMMSVIRDALGETVGGRAGVNRAQAEKSAKVYGDLSQHSKEELESLYHKAKSLGTKPAYVQALQNEARRRGIVLI